MRNDYLLPPDHEKAYMDVAFNGGLLAASMINAAVLPSTPEDKLSYRHSMQLATSLACFENEEQLKKDWEGLNWSIVPLAPDLVASSGNQVALQQAPIDWALLRMSQPSNSSSMYHSKRPIPHPSWLTQKIILGTHEWFGHIGNSNRVSDIHSRVHNKFWETLLKAKKLSGNTQLPSRKFGFLGEGKLFDECLVYGRSELVKKMLKYTKWSKAEAEETLASLVVAHTFHGTDIERSIPALVATCCSYQPDLNRKFLIDTSKSYGHEAGYYDRHDEGRVEESPLSFWLWAQFGKSAKPLSGMTSLLDDCVDCLGKMSEKDQHKTFKMWSDSLNNFSESLASPYVQKLWKLLSPSTQTMIIKDQFAHMVKKMNVRFRGPGADDFKTFKSPMACVPGVLDEKDFIKFAQYAQKWDAVNIPVYIQQMFDESLKSKVDQLATLVSTPKGEKRDLQIALFAEHMKTGKTHNPALPKKM